MTQRAKDRGPTADAANGSGPGVINIVLADDHAIFRGSLRRLLTLEPDFKVVAEAKDGSEVVPLIEEHDPDILLLDLRMPVADGLAVLRRIQADKLRTKTLVLTASEDEDEYVQAMKYGASGIVLKQTVTELLLKSIRKVVEGETWLDAGTTAAVMRQFASSSSQVAEKPVLSEREREIAACVAQSLKNKEIGDKLFISEQTVKNHLHNIFQKLGVSDRLELALYAIKNNIAAGETSAGHWESPSVEGTKVSQQ